MNVVILNDISSVNGGAAKVALEEARALASVGHHVYLVCGVGPVAHELEDQENLTVHCVGDHDILTDPNRLRAMARGWWNPVSGKYVEELLHALSPRDTVVHVHNFSKALSSSVMRAALDRRFELIITLHDFQLACPTGNLFLHNKQQKCTLQPMSTACICTNCDQRSYQHKLWRVVRQAVQNRFGQIPAGAKHFIYHSQTALDLLRKYLPSDATFYGLPIAIEMDYVPPADAFANYKFMFLGRLAREKGPELFARAAAADQVPCQFIGAGLARVAIARAQPDAILSGWSSHRGSRPPA